MCVLPVMSVTQWLDVKYKIVVDICIVLIESRPHNAQYTSVNAMQCLFRPATLGQVQMARLQIADGERLARMSHGDARAKFARCLCWRIGARHAPARSVNMVTRGGSDPNEVATMVVASQMKLQATHQPRLCG